jgi:hypothetical protein
MEENIEGNKVYIYGLLDEHNTITYIGKSISPKTRLYLHSSSNSLVNNRMKILDYFYDHENFWIKKMLSEGHPLRNKEIEAQVETWDIGDIISIFKSSHPKVIDHTTGIIYTSANDASIKLKISYELVKSILKDPNHKSKSLYNLEKIN